MTSGDKPTPAPDPERHDELRPDDGPSTEGDARVELIERWTAVEFSGPLPHPRLLAQYEHILPGLAERIVSMAAREGDHRRSLEDAAIELSRHELDTTRAIFVRGQRFALTIVLCAFLAAGLIVVEVPSAAGASVCVAIVGGTLGAVVAAFLRRPGSPPATPLEASTPTTTATR